MILSILIFPKDSLKRLIFCVHERLRKNQQTICQKSFGPDRNLKKTVHTILKQFVSLLIA